MANCYLEGCERKSRVKGLCNTHYERIRKNGTLEITPVFENLSGHVFGKLKALRVAAKKPCMTWVCQCVCGNEINVRAANLKSGHSKSCGCVRKTEPNRKTH